jgi:hypothetical protein
VSPRLLPLIASCPSCGTDLVDEAFSFWCRSCQEPVSFAKVIAQRGPDE